MFDILNHNKWMTFYTFSSWWNIKNV